MDEVDGALSEDGADAGDVHWEDFSWERSEATEGTIGAPATVVTALVEGGITGRGWDDEEDEMIGISLSASALLLVDTPGPRKVGVTAFGVNVEVVDTEVGSAGLTVFCHTWDALSCSRRALTPAVS